MNRFAKPFAVGAAGLAGAVAIGVGSAGAQPMPPPCLPNQYPTQAQPCMPAGFTPPTPPSGAPQPGGTGGNGGAMPPGMPMPGGGPAGPGGNSGAGGMMLPPLAACAPGQIPTAAAPCKFDSTGMAECGPGGPPKLGIDGSLPPGKPKGLGPQLDMAPPKEATAKLMTLDVEVDGSGETPGTFDVTLVAIKKGIGKAARAQMQEALEGESFIIDATKAKCFADKKSDPDAVADKVSCKVLSKETDDSASTLRATVVTRMKFDEATRQPSFKATKFVIRGKSKI